MSTSIIDFVKNINPDNMINMVLKSFDEIMLLYNLVGIRQDIEICASEKSGIISFTLLMDNDDAAKDICGKLQNQSFLIYGILYHIGMHRIKSSVNVSISK